MRPGSVRRRRAGALTVLLAAAGTAIVAGVAPPAAAAAVGPVVLNEVESSGGTPGDWVELTNRGTTTVDVSGYVVRDNDDSTAKQVVLPARTRLAPGAFLAVDTDPAFGLGSTDSARLYAADGTTLLDSYGWTAHASTTYGRCPDGTGAFTTTLAPTKGAANACGTTPPPPVRTDAVAWPGGQSVTLADAEGVLGEDISGLFYEADQGQPRPVASGGAAVPAPGDVLWAVKNDPGVLYRLLWNGTIWTPDTANGWADGKQLRYPDGTGQPDSEGVTLVAGSSANGVFVATERDNAVDTVSRPAILRFDVSGSATELVATAAWDMTADLPVVGPNLGFEALTWYPDAALVAGGLLDSTGRVYDPATTPSAYGGLFLAGLEGDGRVYAYSLDAAGTDFTRVTDFSSGFPAVMELQYDADASVLRAVCDNTCGGQQTALSLQGGRFAVTAAYDRPTGLPDANDEGFAVAPDIRCVDGRKPAIWADDDAGAGHALRQGTIACTADEEPPTTAPTPPTAGPAPDGGHGPELAATGTTAPVTAGFGGALVLLGAGALALAGRRRRA